MPDLSPIFFGWEGFSTRIDKKETSWYQLILTSLEDLDGAGPGGSVHFCVHWLKQKHGSFCLVGFQGNLSLPDKCVCVFFSSMGQMLWMVAKSNLHQLGFVHPQVRWGRACSTFGLKGRRKHPKSGNLTWGGAWPTFL